MSYTAKISGSGSGTLLSTAAAVEGTDTLELSGFFEDVLLKMAVNLTDMTVSLPYQILGCDSTYGSYAFCYFDEVNYTNDTTKTVTGSIASDGTITLDNCWGFFIIGGTYDGYTAGAWTSTVMTKCNARLTIDVITSFSSKTITTYTYGINITQDDDNQLIVTDFLSYDVDLAIKLYADRSAVIRSQFLYDYYGEACYTYSYTINADTSGIASYTPNITCYTATDLRTIEWGGWGVSDGGYTYLTCTSGKIVTDNDITYPSAPTLGLTGQGTSASPYLIASAADWSELVAYVSDSGDDFTGKYAKVTADIDLTDVTHRPLGYDYITYFNGDLDGGGHTLSNIVAQADADYYGLVATHTGTDASIHDISVGGTLTCEYAHVGGVIGYLAGQATDVSSNLGITFSQGEYDSGQGGGVIGSVSETGVASSCVFTGSISSSVSITAGVIGSIDGGIAIGCVNRGTLNSTATYLAGVVGGMYDAGIARQCVNAGTVSGSALYCAGVAAYVGYGSTLYECVNDSTAVLTNSKNYLAGVACYVAGSNIASCVNYGNLTGSTYYYGGIVSYATTPDTCSVSDCVNYGTVTSEGYYAAGIAGYAISYPFSDCANYGDISFTGSNSSNKAGVGGIVGYSKNCSYSGCANHGAVAAGSASNYVGGIVGYCYGSDSFSGCENTGTITGKNYLAGIMGWCTTSQTPDFDNCENAGTIAGTSYAGGIVGYTMSTCAVDGCFNVGDITTSSSYAGGITGYAKATITDCYNAGAIAGSTYVGGIVGRPYAGNTSLNRCYSTGSVSATGTQYGNIVGVSTSSSTYWTSSNSMTSTYFLSVNDCGGTDSYSTGLSYAQLAALELGEGWTAGDNYTYPRITSIADNDYAKAHAAAVVPADGDSYSSITTGFNVGTPDGVTWTASSGSVEIDGNNVTFSESFSGTLTMTATCGDVSVATELTCNVTVTGVSDITGASREVVSETFYNLAGAPVAEPAEDSKAVYIVVRTYSDGTSEAVKEVR